MKLCHFHSFADIMQSSNCTVCNRWPIEKKVQGTLRCENTGEKFEGGNRATHYACQEHTTICPRHGMTHCADYWCCGLKCDFCGVILFNGCCDFDYDENCGFAMCVGKDDDECFKRRYGYFPWENDPKTSRIRNAKKRNAKKSRETSTVSLSNMIKYMGSRRN